MVGEVSSFALFLEGSVVQDTAEAEYLGDSMIIGRLGIIRSLERITNARERLSQLFYSFLSNRLGLQTKSQMVSAIMHPEMNRCIHFRYEDGTLGKSEGEWIR